MALFFYFFLLLCMFKWLSMAAGICYAVLGVFIIQRNWFLTELEPKVALALGALMMVYGIYRIVRAVMKFRNTDS